MKLVTAIAACLLFAPRAAFCGEDVVKRLSDDVSKLERRVSKTENTLRELSNVLIGQGYYTPEKEMQLAEKQRKSAEQQRKSAEIRRQWAEQRAEFEAMTTDQLEDLILDLEDEIEQAAKQRRLRTGHRRKQGLDRQQRKAALHEQFVAARADKEAREKYQATESRLREAKSVWAKRAAELPAAKAPAGGDE